MSIEFLVTLTYTAALLFMMMIFWGIGLVATMRRMRLDTSNMTIQTTVKTATGSFRVIEKPITGEWKEWSEKRRDNTGRIEVDVVLPKRYQQPQLFSEDDKETDTQEPLPKPMAS